TRRCASRGRRRAIAGIPATGLPACRSPSRRGAPASPSAKITRSLAGLRSSPSGRAPAGPRPDRHARARCPGSARYYVHRNHYPRTDEVPMRLTTTLLGCCLLSLSCGVAHAAPKDDLHDAFAKFLKVKSFRATITDLKKGEQVSSMEFV